MGKRIKGKKWTLDELKREARKYKTRGEFQKNNPRAYKAGWRRNLLNEICKHMRSGREIKWTENMLRKEALKYKTRGEFERESESAYDTCRFRGVLDEVCNHMENLPHWDKPHCVYLIEIFTTNNELYYYVGQTSNLERRLRSHFYNKGSDSPVSDFLNKNPIIFKKHDIVKDNLTYKESLELEQKTIDKFIQNNMNLLNTIGVKV